MKRIEELRNTQAILDNNPALALSPGDLMRESWTVKECLADFIESDQEKIGTTTRMSFRSKCNMKRFHTK